MPRMSKDEVAPYTKKADGYWYFVGDFNTSCPEYGPYPTIAAMEEDRVGTVEKIKEWIKAGRPKDEPVKLTSVFGLRSEDGKNGKSR